MHTDAEDDILVRRSDVISRYFSKITFPLIYMYSDALLSE